MSDFVKFVGRYANELRGVSRLLGTIFGTLPIDPADKSEAVRVLDGLNDAADRIESGLSQILADGRLDRNDLKIVVREVVAELLPDMIGGLAERQARAPSAPRPARVRKPASRLPIASETTGE